MNDNISKLLSVAQAELGYIEKNSNNQLDSKTANQGNKNYTKYARDLYPSLQGQPWCDMFVDWCFVQAFGRVNALQLLGGFSAYTPTSAQYYKDRGQWVQYPDSGDQIFFKNSVRICHTGIVLEKVGSSRVRTIEGNTNNSTGVVPNGGAVCIKEYDIKDSRIAGYGRPDWSILVSPCYNEGWHHDQYGWWYANTENTYYKDCWHVINGHKYYFNGHGYAVTGWQEIDSKWYYFEPTPGHPLECALYTTDSNGIQKPGDF